MKITIDCDKPCDGLQPVTRAEFQALELEMSKLAAITETLKTAVANLEAREADAVPTQAELDELAALAPRIDAIAPTPVEPPAPTPTP